MKIKNKVTYVEIYQIFLKQKKKRSDFLKQNYERHKIVLSRSFEIIIKFL